MKLLRVKSSHLFATLDIIKFILVVIFVITFISFNARVAKQAADTKAIAASTAGVVKGQADILKAIKAVTDDTHTTAAQQTAIIICMLQVPIEQRTTDLQAKCRSSANVSTSNSGVGTTQGSTGTTPSGSSSNSTPSNNSSPSNTSQNPAQNPPSGSSGGNGQPSFLQRNLINPIKNLINAL